ncbi:MAG: LL-diaminopimelate aminotransferase [Lachnospiraceae bacterium]|nr:LL-diaminopimelate aminotransferase [Lachnospiraceae bacterium]
MIPNTNYNNLKDSYLFYNIAQKINAYLKEHEGTKLYRMGIGDVSLPLCDAAIRALHEGVDDQSKKETFHGYMPECGAPFLRETISGYYQKRGVSLSSEEVFVSSGASDELGDILDIFGKGKIVLIMEPAYPAYVDANVMSGNTIIKLPAGKENGFLPSPSDLEKGISPDVIYICSPNNPTGAVFSKAGLKEWVDFANETEALIIFDAAYEAFISKDAVSADGVALPHSIFEIEGARTCAIEICSLSKTAGFTGTRCGYTAIAKDLKRGGMTINDMWVRNRTTKTNGVSYILQKGAAAIFTDEGQRQIHENIDIYKNNAKVLMEAVDSLGVWYTGGENAPYIWMECPGGLGSWEFFDRLLIEHQVVGTPGEGFGKCGEGYFRFSCFGSPEDTVEAAKRLKSFH